MKQFQKVYIKELPQATTKHHEEKMPICRYTRSFDIQGKVTITI
jgi:hypothetical protein